MREGMLQCYEPMQAIPFFSDRQKYEAHAMTINIFKITFRDTCMHISIGMKYMYIYMYIDIAIQHMYIYIYICSVFDHCYGGCNATHKHIIDQHVYMYSIMISNYLDDLEINIVGYHNHTKVVRTFGDQIVRDYLRESPDYLEENTLNCCLLLHNPTLARAMFENCGK